MSESGDTGEQLAIPAFDTEEGAAGQDVLTGDSTEDIYALLRQLGVITAPQYQAQVIQGQQAWQARASGSPSALMDQLMPQIRQLREQLQQAFSGVSKRLGPMGGKQIDREQGKMLSHGGAQLSKMFTDTQQQGVSGFTKFLENLRPALLAQLPQLQTQTQEQPLNYAALGQMLANAAGTAGDAWQQFGSSGAPSMASMNVGYTGFTPAQSAPLAGVGSGYGDFATYGM